MDCGLSVFNNWALTLSFQEQRLLVNGNGAAGKRIKPRVPMRQDQDEPADARMAGVEGRSVSDKKYSILVVDDDPHVRRLFVDYFSHQGWLALQATDGFAALALIANQTVDIIISDIRMPRMDGIELFRIIASQYPRINHILMTSYNVDSYISLIRRHNIGNILVKGADFNLKEVGSYVRSILTGDIFGLERYFPGCRLQRVAIDNYARSEEVCARIARQCPDGSGAYLQMAIDELIANAIFHGVLQWTGIPREEWRNDIQIDTGSAITVTWASDAEKIGVAVEDSKGKLKKVDALRWLDQRDNSGRELEEHGRGLYLVRRLIDRFIINIDPGNRTECIAIQYFNRDHLSLAKPLLIHEI
jgi:CheY-like chemotaxis protein/anti-sigma regulatory factor (Ser/Thr protein kinase)